MKAISIVALLVLVSTSCERKNEQTEGNELESSSKVDLNKLLSEALPLERLQERSVDAEKLFFEPNEDKPYTGWVLKMHPGNSQVNILGLIENGKKTVWLEFYAFVHTFNYLRPKFDRKKVSINY